MGIYSVNNDGDDKTKRKQDSKEISLTEPYEIEDWCKALDCTPTELKTAVNKVGRSAEKVREYLEK